MARTKHRGLDKTDRRILRILQKHGRISNVDLARQVNLSTTPCAERVRRLERDGVITGYKALIDPQSVELTTCIFLEIKLDNTTPSAFERFREAVAGLPEVVECYMIAGEYDYLLKLLVSGIAEHRRFMNDSLPKLPEIQQTRSYIVVDQLKRREMLPIGDEPI